MLDYSELTVYKNANGLTSALGYPINSFLLQNNKPLFVGGGKKKKTSPADADELDYEHLAVPAGLVCMTQTVCRPANEMGANEMGANEMAYEDDMAYANEMGAYDIGANDMEDEIVPEGLYERLLELAETKVPKKMTKRKQQHKHKKTHKNKK
jgi:hypothetical protein